MAKSDESRRDSQCHISLGKEEIIKLRELSERTGLSQSVLVGKLIRKISIETKPNPEIRDLARSVERIGNEVHQILHFAGQNGQISKAKIDETEQLVKELKQEVRKWL